MTKSGAGAGGGGRRAKPGIPKGLWGFTVAAAGFAVFGAVLLVEAALFAHRAERAESTVTGIGGKKTCVRNAGKSGSQEYTCFPVEYRFTTHQGRTVEFTERRAEDKLPAVGDRAPVRYDPADPAADVRFEATALARYAFPAAAFVAGLAGSWLGTVLLLRYRKAGTATARPQG
ncbi:DUF3592 domain-containing protein [Streptomyces sp. 3N207]|uniref:DUF3592 domain-containing protein n=1 Tax=Streptomyces sp. 3N207 TaxID=3457417 RepID=UPI003FD5AB97